MNIEMKTAYMHAVSDSKIAELEKEVHDLKYLLKVKANEIGQLRKQVKDLKKANEELAEDVSRYKSLE